MPNVRGTAPIDRSSQTRSAEGLVCGLHGVLDGPPESDQWLAEKIRLLRERIRVEFHDANLN
jgi:hypothetical protein